MVSKARDIGIIKGFSVSINGGGFPILQFADDTLMFTSGNIEEARVVKNILQRRSRVILGASIGIQILMCFGMGFTFVEDTKKASTLEKEIFVKGGVYLAKFIRIHVLL